MINLRDRSFLTLTDFNQEEIRYLLDLSHQLKKDKKQGIRNMNLLGKNIVLLFDKDSTRTRCAFEVAAFDEGAHVTYLNNSHMGKKESLEDTAKVLGRMYDGIEYRGFDQKIVENLSKYANVPVWNGLTTTDHPTQVLADFMTIEENIDKPLNEIKFVFIGDLSDNVMYALMIGASIMGMEFIGIGPDSIKCDQQILDKCKQLANKSGAKITITSDLNYVNQADVIYTDIWVSMGEDESLYPKRIKALTPYRVTRELMERTNNKKTIFMHCLPSYHDFETALARDLKERLNLDVREVEDEVFRSKQSVVFDEAENRMHSIKAIMVATLGNKGEGLSF